MTGRWSDVLMLEQLVYMIAFMSSACLLLNRILSCEHREIYLWTLLGTDKKIVGLWVSSSYCV